MMVAEIVIQSSRAAWKPDLPHPGCLRLKRSAFVMAVSMPDCAPRVTSTEESCLTALNPLCAGFVERICALPCMQRMPRAFGFAVASMSAVSAP